MSNNGHRDGGPFHPTPVDHKGGHGGPRGASLREVVASRIIERTVPLDLFDRLPEEVAKDAHKWARNVVAVTDALLKELKASH